MCPSKIDENSIYNVAGGIIGSSIFIVISFSIYYSYTDQTNTAIAYGTTIGAVANLFLAFATWRYLGEVRKQVRIMANDTARGKIKEDNKYSSDLMIKLVAPLYFNKSDEILFGRTDSFNREHDYEPGTKAYFNFWDIIKTNMHLAPPSLFSALEKYLDAKDAYWDELNDHWAGTMHSSRAATAEGQRLIEKFDDARSTLSIEIDIVYRNLKDKLRPPDMPTSD